MKFGNPLHVGCWVSQILLAHLHSRSFWLLKGSMIFDTDTDMIFIPLTGCCFAMSGPLESPSILTASSLRSIVMEEECRVPEKLSYCPNPPPTTTVQCPRMLTVALISPALLIQCVRNWLGSSVPSNTKETWPLRELCSPKNISLSYQTTAMFQVMLLEIQNKTKTSILHPTARVVF